MKGNGVIALKYTRAKKVRKGEFEMKILGSSSSYRKFKKTWECSGVTEKLSVAEKNIQYQMVFIREKNSSSLAMKCDYFVWYSILRKYVDRVWYGTDEMTREELQVNY